MYALILCCVYKNAFTFNINIFFWRKVNLVGTFIGKIKIIPSTFFYLSSCAFVLCYTKCVPTYIFVLFYFISNNLGVTSKFK